MQRRHQKVIEEAPAPDLPPKLRDRIGDARRCLPQDRLPWPGTFEFLYEEGEFFLSR